MTFSDFFKNGFLSFEAFSFTIQDFPPLIKLNNLLVEVGDYCVFMGS